MSFEDFVSRINCDEPFQAIEDQIIETAKGRVGRRKSGNGYTYYVKKPGHGNSFASIQPGIWIYTDPSVRQGVRASLSPSSIRTSNLFEKVPSNENFNSSFGHRYQTHEADACELPDPVLATISESYGMVEDSV